MFIDTHSRDSMVKSVCEALKISKFELRDKLYTMDKTAKDDDEYYEMIDAFVMKDCYSLRMRYYYFILLVACMEQRVMSKEEIWLIY